MEDKALLDQAFDALMKLKRRLENKRRLNDDERANLSLLIGQPVEGFRVFDSMASCAAATNASKRLLGNLKKRGCPAFKGSRVYEHLLLPWLSAVELNNSTETDDIDERSEIESDLLKVKFERQQIARDKELGSVIPWTEVDDWLSAKAAKVKSILHDRLCKDLPPKLVGLKADQIAERMQEVEAELVNQFRSPRN